MSDHRQTVEEVKRAAPADAFANVDNMLRFVLQVIRALPASEHVGLVKSAPGNENTAFYAPLNAYVRVNRVAYPDGTLIKILMDSGPGGQNAPAWNTDDTRPDLYLALDHVETDDSPGPAPKPDAALEARIASLEQQLGTLASHFAGLVDTVNAQGRALSDYQSRLQRLEDTPAPVLELPALEAVGNTSRIFGHAHSVRLDVRRKA